jgi:hypothetical protein
MSGERDGSLCLGDQADALSLGLDCQDDATNFRSHLAKRFNDRLARYSINLPERYKKREIELVVKVRSRIGAGEYNFVFFAVPFEGRQLGEVRAIDRDTVGERFGGGKHGHKKPMGSLPANPVQCPNEFVPTWVRRERAKERKHVGAEVVKPDPHLVIEISGGIRNREVNAVGPLSIAGDSDRVGGLVETRAQSLKGFVSEVGNLDREGFGEFDLVFLKSLRIALNGPLIWLSSQERANASLDVINVVPCASEAALGSGEKIGAHD